MLQSTNKLKNIPYLKYVCKDVLCDNSSGDIKSIFGISLFKEVKIEKINTLKN